MKNDNIIYRYICLKQAAIESYLHKSSMHSSKHIAFLLALAVAMIYVIENFSVVPFIGGMFFTYAFISALWIGLICTIKLLPNVRAKGLLKHKRQTNWLALYYAVIYLFIYLMAGLVDGFGKSPYVHSISGLLINTVYIGSILIGRELVRNYLVNSLAKRENYLIFILIALFMAFTSISYNKMFGSKGYMELVKFMAEYFLPALCVNLFAVFLVFWGGPLPSIIYLGIIKAFYWYSPVLPDLKWITAAVIGILCPIFFLILFQRARLEMTKEIKLREMTNDKPAGWIATSILSIAIIWFVVGVFPIYPTVILTGSMEPKINVGDVILVDKRLAEDVNVSDVIQFKKEDILISHRVIEIVEGENGKSYRTKGDNNQVPDVEPVEAWQIKGKVVYVVPKIGLPTLYVKTKNK